ncbi:RimJ/RimL family protein N-acetyltransferase [Streptomyces sp. Ag109_G2-6]|uniref:GNAT family N-acetyltransferase n=1 Tax=Streptomyces TaxID=1883 RepID=UPI0009A49BF6|nr:MULTISPECIES: GNAT family protein [Streptomyces]RPF43822.1 RimJ/RimL family protein N-acetyltransferase [Streptomyces sp. Ag109_G2-6]
MEITFDRYEPAQAEQLVEFLSGDTWPFHGAAVVEPAQARQWIEEGGYDGEDHRAFWITRDGERAGLIRLMDLRDPTPLFDLRIRAGHRGRGLGTAAVAWLTAYVFDEFPDVRRIEANTRQDNAAMRRVLLRNGYVKEAHHRDAWPAPDGGVRDAVGYAILRRDWLSGTTTVPDWDDEPGAAPVAAADGPRA